MRASHPFSLLLIVMIAFGLAAQADAATLTLAWDPPAEDNIEGYVVFYGTSSGVYTRSIEVGEDTTFDVTGLADSTKYFFVVKAYDDSGTFSEPSNEVSGTTPAAPSNPGYPNTPNGTTTDGLSGVVRTNRYLDLAWLPAPGSPNGYRVEVGTLFGETSFSALTRDQSIVFDMTDLPVPTYFIRVRAIYGTNYGYPSEELVLSPSGSRATGDAATPPDTRVQCVAAPNAPRQFGGSARGAAVTLKWQPGSGAPAAGYLLQVGTAPGLQNVLTAEFEANATGVNAVAANAAYALRLTSVNACGPSVWGPETMFYVGVEPLPGAPPALVQQVTGSLVSLAWKAPTTGGRVTRYLIEALTPVGPFVYDTVTPVLGFHNADTPPGRYFVTVRAGNATGFGPASRPVTVVVP